MWPWRWSCSGVGGGGRAPILGWNQQQEALTVLGDVSDVGVWHTLTEQRRHFLSKRPISVGYAWHFLTSSQKWSCFISGIKRVGVIYYYYCCWFIFNYCSFWRNWVWFFFLLMTMELLEVWMFYFTCLLKRRCDAVSLSLTFSFGLPSFGQLITKHTQFPLLVIGRSESRWRKVTSSRQVSYFDVVVLPMGFCSCGYRNLPGWQPVFRWKKEKKKVQNVTGFWELLSGSNKFETSSFTALNWVTAGNFLPCSGVTSQNSGSLLFFTEAKPLTWPHQDSACCLSQSKPEVAF